MLKYKATVVYISNWQNFCNANQEEEAHHKGYIYRIA